MKREIQCISGRYVYRRTNADGDVYESVDRPNAFMIFPPQPPQPRQVVPWDPYDVPCLDRCGAQVTIDWRAPAPMTLRCAACREARPIAVPEATPAAPPEEPPRFDANGQGRLF